MDLELPVDSKARGAGEFGVESTLVSSVREQGDVILGLRSRVWWGGLPAMALARASLLALVGCVNPCDEPCPRNGDGRVTPSLPSIVNHGID